VRTRDVEAARRFLTGAGRSSEILRDGTIELNDPSSVEHPDDVNCLLVKAGTPPTQLMVEEEELEHYFLRLIGMDGGGRNE
jgi:ABC-2 type transport system ATP-binding protein